MRGTQVDTETKHNVIDSMREIFADEKNHMNDSKQMPESAEDWGLSLKAITTLSGAKPEHVLNAAQEAGVTHAEMLAALPNDTVADIFSRLGFDLHFSGRTDGPPMLSRKARGSLFYLPIYTTSALSFADRPDVPQAAEVIDYLQLVRGLAPLKINAKGFRADSVLRNRVLALANAAREGDGASFEMMVTNTIEAVRLLAEVEKYQPKMFQEVLRANAVWPILDARNGKLKVVPIALHHLGKTVPFGVASKVVWKNATGRVALQLLTFLHAHREVTRKLVAAAKLLKFRIEPPVLAEMASLPDFDSTNARHWVKVARNFFEASYPDTSQHPLLRKLAKFRPAPYKHSSDAFSNVAKRIIELAGTPAARQKTPKQRPTKRTPQKFSKPIADDESAISSVVDTLIAKGVGWPK